MAGRVDAVLEVLRRVIAEPMGRLTAVLAAGAVALGGAGFRLRWRLAALVLVALLVYAGYRHPPFATVPGGQLVVRTNQLNGTVATYSAGTVLAVPGIHLLRQYPTRDQVYRLTEGASAAGAAPFQSTEGLSIGIDLTVRWAIDRGRIAQMSRNYPDDLNADLVRPAVQGIAYPLFARYSVREIFTGKRSEIQRQLAAELAPRLASMGLLLRGVSMGQVDLPQDYRAGMEKLLAEELETEKVRYTLQLKEAQVKQTALESEADKVRRESAAEAAGA